jgi:Cu/Ag efflux protein CusF
MTSLLATLVTAGMALTIAAASPSSIAHIHGKVMAIDSAHGTFQIHHDPFPAMPMAMTMEVKPKNPADVRALHIGEVIDLTVDTSAEPWTATGIHPAPAPNPAGTAP